MNSKISFKNKIFIICAVVIAVAVCGVVLCRRGNESSAPAPFSSLTWESTYEDMVKTEGNSINSYDSIYGGPCYTYPKEYEGFSGTVKYMFDDNNALMSIAWSCTADELDVLDALYKKIEADVNSVHGESGYKPAGGTNYGNVWYLETGNIILSIMNTNELKALQYSYLHPDVSHTQDN